MNKLIVLGQTRANTLKQQNLLSLIHVHPQQLQRSIMKSVLKKLRLSSVQRRSLLLRAIETSLLNSILLSLRLRCAEIGKFQAPASSATRVHSHTATTSLSRRSTFHLTSRRRHAFSFMRPASVHMEADANSCILSLAYSGKRRVQTL
jgi:hypothetical protein